MASRLRSGRTTRRSRALVLIAMQVEGTQACSRLHEAQGQDARLHGARRSPLLQVHGRGLRKSSLPSFASFRLGLSVLWPWGVSPLAIRVLCHEDHTPSPSVELLRAQAYMTSVQRHPPIHPRAVQERHRLRQVGEAPAPARGPQPRAGGRRHRYVPAIPSLKNGALSSPSLGIVRNKRSLTPSSNHRQAIKHGILLLPPRPRRALTGGAKKGERTPRAGISSPRRNDKTGPSPRPGLDPSRIPQRVAGLKRLAERAASLDGGSLTPALVSRRTRRGRGAEKFFSFPFQRWKTSGRRGGRRRRVARLGRNDRCFVGEGGANVRRPARLGIWGAS